MENLDNTPEPRRSLPPGLLFGMVVGVSMGAMAGAASAQLLGVDDHFATFVWCAAFTGAFVGATVVAVEQFKREKAEKRRDTATHVGLVLGMVPSLALLLNVSFGFIRGRFSAYLFASIFFVGPMAGMLLGGVLDRIRDMLFSNEGKEDETQAPENLV